MHFPFCSYIVGGTLRYFRFLCWCQSSGTASVVDDISSLEGVVAGSDFSST